MNAGLARDAYRVASEAYLGPQARTARLLDYHYVPDVSDDTVAVYKNDRRVYVGYKGTSNASDLAPDVALLMNRYSNPRHAKATDTLKKIQQLYPDHEIITTGHSLGGAMAQDVLKAVPDSDKIYDITFNAAGNPLRGGVKSRAKSQRYHVRGDLLSVPGLFDRSVRYVSRTAKNVHALDNFATL